MGLSFARNASAWIAFSDSKMRTVSPNPRPKTQSQARLTQAGACKSDESTVQQKLQSRRWRRM